jgi:hypothetical protein
VCCGVELNSEADLGASLQLSPSSESNSTWLKDDCVDRQRIRAPVFLQNPLALPHPYAVAVGTAQNVTEKPRAAFDRGSATATPIRRRHIRVCHHLEWCLIGARATVAISKLDT